MLSANRGKRKEVVKMASMTSQPWPSTNIEKKKVAMADGMAGEWR
jgi:hypothetical protein